MVSDAFVKLSSPVARSCLVALGIALMIDAVLTFFAASQYPYLIPYTNELYIPSSITFTYSAIGVAAILLAISTALAIYKSSTNFVLIHACITGVFLPFTILVYFSSLSSRYKVSEYTDDYKQMIADYRVASQQVKLDKQTNGDGNGQQDVTTSVGTNSASAPSNNGEQAKQFKLTSFINLIDSIQTKFSCCGVESFQDWTIYWNDYIPPTCCTHSETKTDPNWSKLFKVDKNYDFRHCDQTNVHHLGCLAALKEDEKSKFAWLSNLIVFLMIMTITNTILTLLLYGLSKTENMPYDTDENELAMVGVSMKPRPSQPEITGIRHRPSVVQTIGPTKDQITNLSHAVRFNLANSPRGSMSGPSKFSAAARRVSAVV